MAEHTRHTTTTNHRHTTTLEPPFIQLCPTRLRKKNDKCNQCRKQLALLSRRQCAFCGYRMCKQHANKSRADPSPIYPQNKKFHRICQQCDRQYLRYRIFSKRVKQIEQLRIKHKQKVQESERIQQLIQEKQRLLKEKNDQVELIQQNFRNSVLVCQAKINSAVQMTQKINEKNNMQYQSLTMQHQLTAELDRQLAEQDDMISRHQGYIRQDAQIEQNVINDIARIRMRIEGHYVVVDRPSLQHRDRQAQEFMARSNTDILQKYEGCPGQGDTQNKQVNQKLDREDQCCLCYQRKGCIIF